MASSLRNQQYRSLLSETQTDPEQVCRSLWSTTDIQPQVRHFLWHAMLDALMANEPRKYVIPIADESLCCLHPETPSHLLIHCSQGKEVWSKVQINFQPQPEDTIHSVVSKWLRLSREEPHTDLAGSMLMRHI